jgi:predicted transcriptional regulator
MAKAAAAREIPPPLELLCLKALWSLGQGNVHDVRRVMSQTRPFAYTTVMTLLDRLARKGIVSRRKTGRAFLYLPEMTLDAMRRLALREFLNTFFDGSEEQLLQYLHAAAPSQQPHETAPANGQSALDPALL